MNTINVIIELKSTKALAKAAAPAAEFAAALDTSPLPAMAGVELDTSFPITPVSGMKRSDDPAASALGMVPDMSDEGSTYIVRGTMDEKDFTKVEKLANVTGVYADVVIESCPATCPAGPVGTHLDVEALLCASRFHRQGMDGSGVMVAVVDTGVNMAWMNSHGKSPRFDAARSWVPRAGLTPGSMPVDHGTMCAFDICIAAPRCTLLDIALLSSNARGRNVMEGLLSDAVRAYQHLMGIMGQPRRPGENRSLVVNNSWGMFHPDWDFPVGHQGNYSDNPGHPFNRIVGALAAAGADILFAAGNCGAECPDGRCRNLTNAGIFGANSHPDVLCVAGVTKNKVRIGYSTQGPGRLARNKPDISGFTHFQGSGVYAADGGTSAATPVVAGVVAAIRNKRPFDATSPAATPAAIRSLITSTAEDAGPTGYDFDHGFGIVNGCAIATRFERPASLCDRFPWLCPPPRFPIPIPDLCRRYPQLCGPRDWPFPLPPRPNPLPPQPGPLPPSPAGDYPGAGAWAAFPHSSADYAPYPGEMTSTSGSPEGDLEQIAILSYLAGLSAAQGMSTAPPQSSPCGCGGKASHV